MNVLISADMEGISGVVSWDHVDAQHKEYERFRKLMTAEVNAAIEGALTGGAERVVVNDSHGGMKNILIEDLNDAAELISGSPKPFGMMQGIGPGVDAVFLVGYHAAAGTAAAILAHTWSSRTVTQVQLNGQVVGETGLNAALAGSFGAPVLLVTGDRAVTEEARALLGEIETVAVKDGITRSAARCLHPEVVHRRIRQAAERALRLKNPPFVLEPPITVRVTFKTALQAEQAALIPGSRRVDGLLVEWTGDDMPTAYKTFRGMVGLAWTGN
ncbi:MAG TPA: peptidase M55 [Chloroflexi bacterium]|nr:peptidase M55 [Chloroflexota bacterium]